MLFSLVLGLIIGSGAVVFALQNVFSVTVSFLGWELTSSLAVLLILSMIVGALISILITIPSAIRNHLTISKLQKENKRLAEVVNNTKNEDVVVATKLDLPNQVQQ